ncbi:hypothetical protein LZ30DRAFT_714014 [Colletotrichum cereale]|nr:hypothetical protein LZ30DRAFT_714014 [Colletotrichum cereale]
MVCLWRDRPMKRLLLLPFSSNVHFLFLEAIAMNHWAPMYQSIRQRFFSWLLFLYSHGYVSVISGLLLTSSQQ